MNTFNTHQWTTDGAQKENKTKIQDTNSSDKQNENITTMNKYRLCVLVIQCLQFQFIFSRKNVPKWAKVQIMRQNHRILHLGQQTRVKHPLICHYIAIRKRRPLLKNRICKRYCLSIYLTSSPFMDYKFH